MLGSTVRGNLLWFFLFFNSVTWVFLNLEVVTLTVCSIAQRLVFISISLIFYEFDLSFDNMNEDKGKLDGLLDLFPQRQSVGLTVRLNAVKNVVGQSAEPVKDIQL